MRRGRTLFWTIIGSVVAAVAVVIALILVNSGTPPKAASSPVAHTSASASPQAAESAPVVIPETSSTSSFSYLADLTPSGNDGGLVIPGPVKISGSIYPKSISFYCNNGDPAATPAYKLRQNARRFKATVGLEAKSFPHFEAGGITGWRWAHSPDFSVSAPLGQKPSMSMSRGSIRCNWNLQLRYFAVRRLGRCCRVGQCTCHTTTLTAEWRGHATSQS